MKAKLGEGGRMKKEGGDKQKKMLGARERGREDEREIKRGIEGTEVQESGLCLTEKQNNDWTDLQQAK